MAASEDTKEAVPGMKVGTALWHIMSYTAPYKGRVALVILTLVIDVAFDTAMPLSLKFLIDNAITPRDAEMFAIIITCLVGAFILTACSQVSRDWLYGWLGSKVLGDLREKLYGHIQRMSPGFFSRTNSADLVARFSTDLSAVENAIILGMPAAMLAFLQIIISTTILIMLDWRLALIVILGLPLCLIGPHLLGPRATAASYNLQTENAALSASVLEAVSAHPVVRAFSLQDSLRNAFVGQSRRLTALAGRFIFLSYSTERAPNISMQLFSLGVIGGGGWLAYKGIFSIGDLVAFNALYGAVAASVLNLTSISATLLQATGGMQRIQEVLVQTPEVVSDPQAVTLPSPLKTIDVEGVNFGYLPGQTNLTDVSYRIPAGCRAAFVGPSGSGKSTNLNLVLRFYDPASGRVSIDGQDLRGVSHQSLYDQMGVVFQESFLFNTTIRENIRMGKPGASDAEVEAASKLAELHDIVLQLPQGYDTPVGERGAKLSGGQRQRVAIARALIRNPGVIVLDEATSALDPATEQAVNQTLERVSKGRTVLAVTHRLETITGYDLILVFDQGRLVEQGTHDELLRRGGRYASLWNRQSGLSLSDDGTMAHIEPASLKAIPLFANVALDDIEKMYPLFGTEHVAAGQTVIRQGAHGDKFFIIVRGKVSVDVEEKGAPAKQVATQVATLADGDFFGEMSLLSHAPTTATVTTLQPTIFLTLRRDHFRRFVHRYPSMRDAIQHVASERRHG